MVAAASGPPSLPPAQTDMSEFGWARGLNPKKWSIRGIFGGGVSDSRRIVGFGPNQETEAEKEIRIAALKEQVEKGARGGYKV